MRHGATAFVYKATPETGKHGRGDADKDTPLQGGGYQPRFRAARYAVKACAYRSGESLYDDKEKCEHDYSNKHVIEAQLFTPEKSPDWMKDPDQHRAWERFGNEIEKVEDSHNRRAEALLAKDFQAAAPRELTPEQNWAMGQKFVQKLNDRGFAVAAAFHEEDAADGEKNPHFHFMVPMRTVDEDGFSKKKYRGLDARKGQENKEMKTLRCEYYQCVNEALAEAGVQGIYYDPEKQEDKEPTVHMGKAASAMERKGKKTRLGQHNQQIEFNNKVRPYVEAVENSETPPFQPPARAKNWNSTYDEWRMRRGVAHAKRDATKREQVVTPDPPGSRVDRAVNDAQEIAKHRWQQKEVEKAERRDKEKGRSVEPA